MSNEEIKSAERPHGLGNIARTRDGITLLAKGSVYAGYTPAVKKVFYQIRGDEIDLTNRCVACSPGDNGWADCFFLDEGGCVKYDETEGVYSSPMIRFYGRVRVELA